MAAREYDLIVIGAGAVGENVADYATKGGLTAVIVEAELVGGECSYWACMPSKGLLRAGAALRAARAVDGAKQAVTGEVDAAGAFARRTVLTHDWDDTLAGRLARRRAKIDLVRGHAHFTGERAVTVVTADGEVELIARHAVTVSTGSDPLIPDIPGLRRHRAVDQPGRDQRHRGARRASRSSAAASSAARWRRRTPASAPKVTHDRARRRRCSPGRSRSPARPCRPRSRRRA